MKQKISVLLADDSKLVRQGDRDLLALENDIWVIGEAKNGREAVTQVKKLKPNVVLMDVAMPLLNGLHATREILQKFPATAVLMLSAFNDAAYITEANNVGAMGYLLKTSAMDYVCLAIREVIKGNMFYDLAIPRRLHSRR